MTPTCEDRPVSARMCFVGGFGRIGTDLDSITSKRMRKWLFVLILVALCFSACSASRLVEPQPPTTSTSHGMQTATPPTSTISPTSPAGVIGVSECEDDGEACSTGFTLIVPDCDGQTEAVCSDEFTLKIIGRIFYNLECEAIRIEAVSNVVLARGEIEGQVVSINAIEDVGPNVMVAVENPSEGCGDWSMAVPNSAAPEALHAAICRVGDLPPERREADC